MRSLHDCATGSHLVLNLLAHLVKPLVLQGSKVDNLSPGSQLSAGQARLIPRQERQFHFICQGQVLLTLADFAVFSLPVFTTARAYMAMQVDRAQLIQSYLFEK